MTGVKGVGYNTLTKRFPELKSSEFISVSEIIKLCRQRQVESKAQIFNRILSDEDTPKKNWRLMYLDTTNLAAKQIDKINHISDTFAPSSDKIGLSLIHI